MGRRDSWRQQEEALKKRITSLEHDLKAAEEILVQKNQGNAELVEENRKLRESNEWLMRQRDAERVK